MDIPWFRDLYQRLYEYEGEHPYQDILLPWMKKALQIMLVLQNYGHLEAIQWRGDERREDLWNWYALSRLSDLLLLSLEAPTAEYDLQLMKGVTGLPLRRPKIQQAEYRQFFTDLGMRLIEETNYHPFFHEIVEVEQADDPGEPVTLLEVRWPGFLLHHLLFSRAGVKVRGGINRIHKAIAEHSTLYFTFVRRNRPVSDLSHGWGHNSQWRTPFRRDYEDSSAFYYNVDGRYDLARTDRVLTGFEQKLTEPLHRAERIELLVNRCFICTNKPHHDLCPFYDTYVEKKMNKVVTASERG